jgi:hypothetical protein
VSGSTSCLLLGSCCTCLLHCSSRGHLDKKYYCTASNRSSCRTPVITRETVSMHHTIRISRCKSRYQALAVLPIVSAGGGRNPVWNETFAVAITKETDLTITVSQPRSQETGPSSSDSQSVHTPHKTRRKPDPVAVKKKSVSQYTPHTKLAGNLTQQQWRQLSQRSNADALPRHCQVGICSNQAITPAASTASCSPPATL